MAAKHQRQIHEVSNKDPNGDHAIRWIRTYCDAGGLRISTDPPHIHPSIRFGLCVVGDVDGLHGPLARPPLSLMRNTISRAWAFHKLLSEVQNSELNKKGASGRASGTDRIDALGNPKNGRDKP
jgi:hypothetical protein